MTIQGPLRRGQGVAGLREGRPAPGQLQARRVRRRRRRRGPLLGVLDGRRGDHAGRRADPPSGGGEAVALGGDHDQVAALEREVDRFLPAVDTDGVADERIEDGLSHRLPVPRPHMAADRLGARTRGQVEVRRWCEGRAAAAAVCPVAAVAPVCPVAAVRPGSQHGAGHPALAQGGQGLMGRLAPVDHHRGHPRPRRGLECRLPALVDLDQVEQRAHHAVHPAQELAASRPLQVAQGALECLGPGRAAMPRLIALVGPPLRRLGPLGRPFELHPARRHRGLQLRRGRLQRRRLVVEQVRPHRGGRMALLQAGQPGVQGCHILLLADHGPGQRLRARPHLGHGILGQVVPEHLGPTAAERRLLGVQPARLGLQLGLRRVRRRLVARSRDLSGQVRRLGLEGRDHVDVRRRIERSDHGAAPLAEHTRGPPGPLDQSLHPAEGPGQVLFAVRGQLGRGAWRPRHRAPRGRRGARAPPPGRW